LLSLNCLCATGSVTKYWAHSDPSDLPETHPSARWQPLNQHLRQVGALAEVFAKEANRKDHAFHIAARAAGQLHDLGKYTLEFQRKIHGEATLKAPHSAHGSAVALRAKAVEVALAIAGHHAGLPNPKGGKAGLWERTQEVEARLDDLWQIAINDCPELSACKDTLVASSRSLTNFDLRTRMLFSCLVDADRIDSSGENETGQLLAAALRLDRLLAFIDRRAAEVSDGPVKRARMTVLEACRAAAGRPGNLFSLTVPTGGAKTLGSMAFALERALAFPDLRRIIVVIPYLSIIEQNAQVFIDALGRDAILEHHSGDTDTRENEDSYENPHKRRATENWDAPIIVTTSVRFFESLFSHRTSDLRRVHNLARSIVILDEVQTLPRQFIQPILSMVEDLASNWRTTFLFTTATQPAFERSKPEDSRWPPGTIQEIMPRPRELFAQLKRVEVEWPTEKSTWEQIADGLVEARRALCIVNTRNHALALYREVSGNRTVDKAAVFHLSTRMCPAHRLRTIGEIKERLKNKAAPCVVVSTQLVEAGVDLDFPVVYRAVGPLDSIAQAAGRCDREGLLTAELGRPAGKVIVFEPEEPRLPPGVYREATERTQALIREGGLSIDNPDCIRQYFDRLYGEANLGKELEELRTNLKFRDVSEAFEMIAKETQSIFVSYDAEARNLIAQLNAAGVLYLSLRRSLQRYTIGLYSSEVLKAAQRGIIYEVRPGSDLWICPEGFYGDEVGFVMEPTPAQMVQ
jgi:CRISPR-associated endonuclease/helicase Cas3